jgi:Cu+-exporting ATPase
MTETVRDPVCGMQVKVETAKWTSEHLGKRWYFCCEKCKKKFEADQAKYDGSRPASAAADLVSIGGMSAPKTGGCCGGNHAASPQPQVAASAAGKYTCPMHPEVVSDKMGSCPKCGMALEPTAPMVTRVEYTCPMHPEIVKDGPGSCPICGMALEPREVTADQENPELKTMLLRFWVGVALSGPSRGHDGDRDLAGPSVCRDDGEPLDGVGTTGTGDSGRTVVRVALL